MIRAPAFAFILLASLAATLPRLAAEEHSPDRRAAMPESLKGMALAVRVHAFIPSGHSSGFQWEESSTKFTVPGTPVGVKLVGSNAVIVFQVTPFDRGAEGITIVAQGQVWVSKAGGGLSYRTSINSVAVAYGETVVFHPLGLGPEGASQLRIEIVVARVIPGAEKAEK